MAGDVMKFYRTRRAGLWLFYAFACSGAQFNPALMNLVNEHEDRVKDLTNRHRTATARHINAALDSQPSYVIENTVRNVTHR